MSRFELRCPIHRVRLFAVLHGPSSNAHIDRTVNLVEVDCPPCKRDARKAGERVSLVLHRFNLLGECVETVRR